MAKRIKGTSEPIWMLDAKFSFRELFVELEAILKGIDRFFNVDNLPMDLDDITNPATALNQQDVTGFDFI